LFQVAGVPSRKAGYPLGIIPVPPILAARIFPTPGQQEGFSPSRFEFFHSFPHQGRGENLGFRIKTNYFQLLLPIAYRLSPIAHSLFITCCINNSLFHKGCVFFNTKGRGNKGPKNIKSPALGQPRLFRNHIFIVAWSLALHFPQYFNRLEKLLFFARLTGRFEKYMLSKEKGRLKSGIKIANFKQKVSLFCFLRRPINHENFSPTLPPKAERED
jgi:hypothetical protein